MKNRYAIVRGATADRDHVAAYLYGNYDVVAETADGVLISGVDSAGFTLEAITDRLFSGLYFTSELVER